MTPAENDRHDQFLRLHVKHEEALNGFLRALVPTRDDAQEVMQEVAVLLRRKFEELPVIEDFRLGRSEWRSSKFVLSASFAMLTRQTLTADAGPNSFNVLPALLGESKAGRDTLIEQGGPIAVRQGNWKLISTGKALGNKKKVVVEDKDRTPRDTGAGGGLQLFNLTDDLPETKNLADQQPEKTKELAEILRKVRETGRTR
jgi:hypothetical protein